MAISRESVAHIAQLSRLALSEEELARMGAELAAVLDYMKMLEGAEVFAEPVASEELCNVTRADEVCPSFDRADLLRGAAVHNADSIIVPKTVE